jgi:hypothetical protein
MTNIINLEKGVFSNLQSEFYKFINVLDKTSDTFDGLYLKKIIRMNEQMKLLETMIYELKIDQLKNIKELDNTLEPIFQEQIDDDEKDKQVIDYFKPFMIYYRFLLE